MTAWLADKTNTSEGSASRLGGQRGFLGSEVGGIGLCLDSVGYYSHFDGGTIFWSPSTGAHEVHGDIRGNAVTVSVAGSFVSTMRWTRLGVDRLVRRAAHHGIVVLGQRV